MSQFFSLLLSFLYKIPIVFQGPLQTPHCLWRFSLYLTQIKSLHWSSQCILYFSLISSWLYLLVCLFYLFIPLPILPPALMEYNLQSKVLPKSSLHCLKQQAQFFILELHKLLINSIECELLICLTFAWILFIFPPSHIWAQSASYVGQYFTKAFWMK